MSDEHKACEFHYSMILRWDPLDRIFVVTVPELPGCMTHGATYEAAVQQGQDAIASWVAASEAGGRSVPSPQFFSELAPAGCVEGLGLDRARG